MPRSIAWIPAFVIAFAIRALLARGQSPLAPYDEGLLLTDGFLLTIGQTIYEDFYVNYPPGVLQIERAIIALGFPAIWTSRLCALAVHVASAVVVGWLVGRTRERAFCWWACASVLVLQERLGLVLYAYLVAVLIALVAIASWPRAESARHRWIMTGTLLGCLSYVRHDLFVYAVALMTMLETTWWLVRRQSFLTDSKAQLRQLVLALLGTLSVLWLPVVLSSGIARPLHDLVLDQIFRTQPGRRLPFPAMAERLEVGPLAWHAPAALTDLTRLTLLLALTGSAVAFARLIWRSWRSRAAAPRGAPERASVTPELRTFALITLFAIASLPQALQRSDYLHTTFVAPLSVTAFLAAGGSARLRELLLLLSLLTWLSAPPTFIRWDAAVQLWRDRDDSHFTDPTQLRIAQLAGKETKEGEAIFSGCHAHRRTMMSHMDIYYLARRRGATRYMQFDPGTTNSEQGQREMIADLERTHPKLVLRGPECAWDEDNTSKQEGATLLDAYLDQHYAEDSQIEQWKVWKPKPTR